MITNQIITTNWNYSLIDRRFDIFKLSYDDNFNKNILDIQDDKVKFVSTVYLSGKTAFCMTWKDTVTEIDIRNTIMANFKSLESNLLHIERIPLLRLSHQGEKKIIEAFGYKRQALLQLLINSTLNNPVFKEDAYNNITGRCYYYNRLWNENPEKKIELVDFTIDNKMTLYPTVATFVKEKPHKPSYKLVYDTSLNVIRKATKNDDESVIYYRKGIDGTHASRNAVGTTLQDWETSRLACLARFYTAIKKEMEEYVTLSFTQFQTEYLKAESLDIGKEAIADIHRATGINVIDHVAYSNKEKEKASAADRKRVEEIIKCKQMIISAIRDYCEQNNIEFACSKIRELYRSNLCLVRDRDFYKRNKQLDDLHFVDENCVCQHVTVPFSSKDIQHIVYVLLKELVIKSDLMEKRIRLTDWRKFGFETDMTFFIANYTKNDDDTSSALIAGMTIQPDGTFKTKKISVPDIKNYYNINYPRDEQDIIDCFRSEGYLGKYFDRSIEMALWPDDDIFNAYIIKRTNIRALSDIEEMKKCFDDEKADTVYDAHIILDAIKPFQDCVNTRHEEVCEKICEYLTDKTNVSKSELLPLLKPTPKDGKKYTTIDSAIKEAISEATQTILKVSRTAESEKELGIDVYKHIHLWLREDGEETDGSKWYYNYTVGMVDKPSQSIANSPVVRKIYCKGLDDPDRTFIGKILSLLQVGFVNYKKYTVLPFPAKYLREMINYQTAGITTVSRQP